MNNDFPITESLPSIPVAIRAGALGDMVMFLPVISALAAFYRTDRVHMITTGSMSAQIVRHSQYCGDVIVLSGTSGPLWLSPSKRKARNWLKNEAKDAVYIFERNDKLLETVRSAAIKADKIHRLSSWPLIDTRHQIDDLVDFVDPDIPHDSVIRYPRLDTSLVALDSTRSWLESRGIDANRQLILLQPGNRRTGRGLRQQRASNVKFWPAEHWAAVAQSLLNVQSDAQILLCGSPAEVDFNNEIANLCQSEHLYNIADDLPLPRLMALARLAHSMISVDTGPAHLAGALDCPLVVLFGATSPFRFAPRSYAQVSIVTERGVASSREEIDWQAGCQMLGIKPADVVSAWNETMPEFVSA